MKNTWIIILVIVLAGGAFFYFNSGGGNDDVVMVKDDVSAMEENEVVESKEMEKETAEGEENMETKLGSYENYSPEKVSQATGKVVLFFHAPWCPYCRGLDTAIKQEISKIPSDLIILRTDYDSEAALKKKYGVTYQHTLVQIDAGGNMITKWSGSENLSQILAKII